MNRLYFGDNLDVLRKHVEDRSVDLVYLDPPFNSQARYNLLYETPGKQRETAQQTIFRDMWSWEAEAEFSLGEVLKHGGKIAAILNAMTVALQRSDMMAYLAMMSARLIEIHRVLKPTGSLFLHCDPTASHYLKIALDAIFGPVNFRNEIIWKRTFAHGNVTRRLGDVTDTILYYTKSTDFKWNQPFKTLTDDETEAKYPNADPDGRRWQSVTLRNPGVRPNLHFPYKASNGVIYQPHPNGWSCNLERLKRYDREGRLHFPSNPDGALRLKMYADESQGERLQSLWGDIPPIGAQAQERLGYPTQKPIALIERIISMASDKGDLVLDPFCGCGTTVHAAQELGRDWIGIDVSLSVVRIFETERRGLEGRIWRIC